MISLILEILSRHWCPNGRCSETKRLRAPAGCFPVYVGPEKERFLVRIKTADHPLFGLLLEEANIERRYRNSGPLELPCGVELFQRVLDEIEGEDVGSLACKCKFTPRRFQPRTWPK